MRSSRRCAVSAQCASGLAGGTRRATPATQDAQRGECGVDAGVALRGTRAFNPYARGVQLRRGLVWCISVRINLQGVTCAAGSDRAAEARRASGSRNVGGGRPDPVDSERADSRRKRACPGGMRASAPSGRRVSARRQAGRGAGRGGIRSRSLPTRDRLYPATSGVPHSRPAAPPYAHRRIASAGRIPEPERSQLSSVPNR